MLLQIVLQPGLPTAALVELYIAALRCVSAAVLTLQAITCPFSFSCSLKKKMPPLVLMAVAHSQLHQQTLRLTRTSNATVFQYNACAGAVCLHVVCIPMPVAVSAVCTLARLQRLLSLKLTTWQYVQFAG